MQNNDTKYDEVVETLYRMMPDFQQVGAGAYKPGLERIRAFDAWLGSPSRSFCTIHVAGTNGKGSVSHMLAAVLSAAGYCTGLYTSPHIADFRERIRVDGETISKRGVIDFAQTHMDKMNELGLSFFEATVGMAFDWFAHSDVEVAVIETGLGGRLDATNIITPVLSVITNIGLEHTQFLGDTLELIASEKAGIIKPGVPAVVGERDEVTAPIFIDSARAKGSELFFAEDIFRVEPSGDAAAHGRRYTVDCIEKGWTIDIDVDLQGDYQKRNLTTALAAMRVLHRRTPIDISFRACRDGMANAAASTGLKGRWHVAGDEPLVVCDTGHNAHGLGRVVEQIRSCKYDKLYFVLGVAGDKDLDSILPLLPTEAHYIFTQASGQRSMPVEKLAAAAGAAGLKGETAPTVGDAVARARALAGKNDMVFVGGSTFVVADSELTE